MTLLGIYNEIYPFTFRSSLWLRSQELFQTKASTWAYIRVFKLPTEGEGYNFYQMTFSDFSFESWEMLSFVPAKELFYL